MPSRRASWLLLAGLLVAAFAFWLVATWSSVEHERAQAEDARPRGAAPHPTYDRITKGMSASEVEAVFGRAPDQALAAGKAKRWDLDDRWIEVVFDAQGRVVAKAYKLTPPGPDKDRP